MLNIGVIAHLKHAIKEPFAGGLEMHTHLLCKGLRERGHQVTVFAASGSENPGLEAVSAEMRFQPDSFRAEHSIYLRLMKALEHRSFDLIHNNSLHYLPVALAALLPMPMITMLHTPPFWELEGSMRLSEAPHHCYVAVSEAIRRAWLPIIAVERVIANGIDLERFAFRETPDAEPYVIWYGRIVPEKGLHLAMAAARVAGMRLRFAGPVSDRVYFDTEIAPWINTGAQYLGHLGHADLARAIAGARAFLCTPLWDEPYGLVVAEALACGTPVASFARGAIPDLLDSSCGVLVQPGDVQGLAAAAGAAQRLSRQACRMRAETVADAHAMMNRYESAYQHMIRNHPRASRLRSPHISAAAIAPDNESLIALYSRHVPDMLCGLPGPAPIPCPV